MLKEVAFGLVMECKSSHQSKADRFSWDPVSGDALKPSYFYHPEDAPEDLYDFIRDFWKRALPGRTS